RLAVLQIITELGVTTPGIRTKASITRGFDADLADLMKRGDADTREAAARTLGLINPRPEVAARALSSLLDARETSVRLAATAALGNLVRVVSWLANQSKSPTGVDAKRGDVVQVARAVVPPAGRGLRDSVPEVRRLSAEAIAQAADALRKVLMPPRPAEE